MTQEEISKDWKRFNFFFWTGFWLNVMALLPFLLGSFYLFLIGIIISMFLLCGSLGYFAYKFSGKKRNFIMGVLGIPIFMGPITPFVGYFVVLGFKRKSAKAVLPRNSDTISPSSRLVA